MADIHATYITTDTQVGKFSATADVLFTTAQVLNKLAVSSNSTFIMLAFSKIFCKSFNFQLKNWS